MSKKGMINLSLLSLKAFDCILCCQFTKLERIVNVENTTSNTQYKLAYKLRNFGQFVLNIFPI